MTYLTHVTLMTGHAVRQEREGRDAVALASLHPLLDSLLTGGRPEVPGRPDYLATGAHSGRDLTATLWRGPWDVRIPILTTGVALRARSAPALWRMLHDTATATVVVTDRERPPPPPWIADRIEAGAALDPTVPLMWTGAWAATLGWAWCDYVEEGRHADPAR